MSSRSNLILTPACLLVAMLGLLTPATSIAEVDITWHRNADTSQYKTFAWQTATGTKASGAEIAFGSDFEALVREAVEARLLKRGFERALRGTAPDFYVKFDAAVEGDVSSETARAANPSTRSTGFSMISNPFRIPTQEER